MKVIAVEFLEPVESPVLGRGGGRIDRMRSVEGPMRVRPQGPGLIIEQEGNSRACIVPWANVKYAMVEMEPGDEKGAAKR